MTLPYDELLRRDAELNDHFRGHGARDWQEWVTFATRDAEEVPLDAERAWVTRVKASHRGIGRRQALRHLVAASVDQDYLDEVCTLEGLERLELEYPVTARSLDGLPSLRSLRHLSIDSPRNVTDFSPLVELPSLRTLLVSNAKHLSDLDWLAGADHLEVIGVEGSIWSTQRIASLRPLAGLAGLRALLVVSTRLGDRDLSPLGDCPRLEYLRCPKFVPRAEFERLQARKPELVCTWCHPDGWH